MHGFQTVTSGIIQGVLMGPVMYILASFPHYVCTGDVGILRGKHADEERGKGKGEGQLSSYAPAMRYASNATACSEQTCCGSVSSTLFGSGYTTPQKVRVVLTSGTAAEARRAFEPVVSNLSGVCIWKGVYTRVAVRGLISVQSSSAWALGQENTNLPRQSQGPHERLWCWGVHVPVSWGKNEDS